MIALYAARMRTLAIYRWFSLYFEKRCKTCETTSYQCIYAYLGGKQRNKNEIKAVYYE